MKYSFILLFLTATLAISCKKEEKATTPNNNFPPVEIRPFSQMNNPVTTQTPVASQQQQTVINPPVASNPAAKGANPAHGQPGHRCDIPVGAPLNSPVIAKPRVQAGQKMQQVQPTQPTTPAPITQSIVVPPPATGASLPETIAAPTAPGMNPPHGQTNHRCDIAVGAPLPKQ